MENAWSFCKYVVRNIWRFNSVSDPVAWEAWSYGLQFGRSICVAKHASLRSAGLSAHLSMRVEIRKSSFSERQETRGTLGDPGAGCGITPGEHRGLLCQIL